MPLEAAADVIPILECLSWHEKLVFGGTWGTRLELQLPNVDAVEAMHHPFRRSSGS